MRNIVSRIKSKKILELFKSMEKDLKIKQLNVENIEEFIHALSHFRPTLIIIELIDKNDSFYKIIRIIKKSILIRGIPLVIVANTDDYDFVDKIAKEKIEAIIYKPISKAILELYIKNFIKMIKIKDDLQIIQDLKTVQTVMISGLASLAEYRDPETGEHIKRTQNYVKALAITLMRMGYYKDELTIENIEAMYMSVPLHDIGKVGISDRILLKPGRLTKDEFEIMKTHAYIGYETIISVGNKLKNSSFLEYAAEVAYTHHEKYDGSGYPRGLKGEKIPLIGRLMAVADVYDALTTKRVYKEAMTHEEAINLIKEGSGSHFDPIVVKCMLKLETTFRNIAETYRDYELNTNKKFHFLKELVKNKELETVLVVEDSRIVREITKNQLSSVGLKVSTASNGLEGYELAKKEKFDLILLDIEMPKMNGYTMANMIKKLEVDTILIAMTAADYSITLSELKKFNISGIVLKPIDFNRIANIYKEQIRKKDK